MARRGRSKTSEAPKRQVDYRNPVNPFPTMDVFSAGEVANMHDTALRTLEELGVRVLLPEARDILAKGGARVDEDMVHIGRDMVAAAFDSAPRKIVRRAGARDRDVTLAPDGPAVDPDRADGLRAFIAKRTADGGAAPER